MQWLTTRRPLSHRQLQVALVLNLLVLAGGIFTGGMLVGRLRWNPAGTSLPMKLQPLTFIVLGLVSASATWRQLQQRAHTSA